MTHWMHKLDLKNTRKKLNGFEITKNQACAEIAAKLKELEIDPLLGIVYGNQNTAESIKGDLEDLIEKYDDWAKDEDMTVDDFDNLLEELYDWGDIKPERGMGNCWINFMSF